MSGKQLLFAYDMDLSHADTNDARKIALILISRGLNENAANWLALNCIANLKPAERPNQCHQNPKP